MATQKFMVGDEQKRCPSAPSFPIDPDELISVQEALTQLDQVVQAHNHHSKRPTLRHVARRKSNGARFMRRSSSMEGTNGRQSPSQQNLKPLSPLPVPTFTTTTTTTTTTLIVSNSLPLSSIVSPRECAKPIEQTFHAMANQPRESSNSPVAETLRSVTNQQQQQRQQQQQQQQQQQTTHDPSSPPSPRLHRRTRLISHFIQQPHYTSEKTFQRRMEDEYRTINHYLHPMQSSLQRCLAAKKKFTPKLTRHQSDITATTWMDSIHADQRTIVHRNHIKRVMGHQQATLVAEEGCPKKLGLTSTPVSSPWVASLWDRVWNNLINA